MGKRKKHPDAPKAAMAAYMWFCREIREKVKEEDSSLGAKEILVELGKRWKALGEEEKKVYTEMADKDKQRYEREKDIFLRTHESLYLEAEDTGRKRKGKKKDPNAPKRARSAYILFVNEQRALVIKENDDAGKPKMKQTEIMSEVAKRWKEASESAKEKFHRLAEKEKERYQEEMAAYKQRLGEQEVDGYY